MKRAVLALALLLAAQTSAARELWRSGERVLESSGSLREVLTTTNGTSADEFLTRAGSDASCLAAATFADCAGFEAVGDKDVWLSLTRARVTLDARASKQWSATLTYDHEWRGGTLDTFEGALGDEPETLLDLEDEIELFGLEPRGDHFRWRHRLYRGYVRYEGARLHLTIGRQRLAWGTGRLWNPIDRLSAVGPLAIESDEFGGIDAVEARWMIDGDNYLQAVAAPGDHAHESRYALRFHGVVRDVDVSLLAGSFEQAWAAGADLAGNLGGAAWRIEAVWTDPEREVWLLDDAASRQLAKFWQAVFSIDYTLDVGPGVYLLFEHLYDGNALGFGRGRAGVLLPFFASTGSSIGDVPRPHGSERFGGSRVISLAKHTTGAQLGADVTAAVRVDLLVLYDWTGSSAAFAPIVSYTGFNSLELRLGAQLFAGPRRSQFGAQQAIGFAIAEWFF
ncbi:MAG: hypothetical protein FJ091_14975 [Deltaproteobacteria bacterium]|nr:hypothetical protein [Deltaproteobacteria bacterium]